MNYVKKMCILRQIKQGFSGDGKPLSGLIKIEQYGKNLAVEISIINFAPLSFGEYYCLLSDGKGKTEMLALRGKSIFNILSDVDISNGFCGIICHVKNEVTPIAYGINGNGVYDWRAILNATLPPVFPRSQVDKTATTEIAESVAPTPDEPTPEESPKTKPSKPNDSTTLTPPSYDDEEVATDNYYKEQDDERKQLSQTQIHARAQSANQGQDEKEGANLTEDVDAESVLRPIATEPDGYYLSVKAEIDGLFSKYPRDDTLCGAFSCSEWVRVQGEKDAPQYLVGVLYDDGKAKYICYALAAKDKDSPPEEIRDVCSFVPTSVYNDTQGFFVIFQSATSGVCVKPNLA